MEEPLYAFIDVSVSFDAQRALDGVQLEIPAGGVTVLTGSSGAGKSTLLRLCNRLEVPTTGTVRYRGQDLDQLDPLALRRQVGMVFQRPSLFPGTVRENLRLARPDGDETLFATEIERAGLHRGFLDRVGDELSGGEAQRACLARTLVTEPQVLLMDEPTSSVDPETVKALEGAVRGLADDGVAVIWVTHDHAQGERIGDHHVELRHGVVTSCRTRGGAADGPG